MSGTFFDPKTGESFTFGEGQQPPEGWRELQPSPPWPGMIPGGCVYYPPGREPRLYVDPATGETRWSKYPYLDTAGLLPVRTRRTPPAGTGDGRTWFNPATGEYFRFGPGVEPPPGWKRLGTLPPPPGGEPADGAVEQGCKEQPRIYVDPQTGEARWVEAGGSPPDGWKPLRRLDEPPLDAPREGTFFDPETGRFYEFGPGQRPPPNWKKLGPIPPHTPGLPPGSTVYWVPGREPRLYVDPATGEVHWVRWLMAPEPGWKPLNSIAQPPGGTTEEGTHFNPRSGEAYRFGPGQTPPPGWKKLAPLPERDPGMLHHEPGREPMLVVDPTTGKSRWMDAGETPPDGWIPLRWRFAAPWETRDEGAHFLPETGHSYVFGPDETPPPSWRPLEPVPPPPGEDAESEAVWIPGFDLSPFVDPATGSSGWFGPGLAPPAGWRPLTSLLTAPGVSAPTVLRYPTEPEPPIFDLEDWTHTVAGGIAGLHPVVEWATWNPGWGLTASQKGYITYMRGSIFEWFAGNNLGRTFPAADYMNPSTIGQIKSIYSTNTKYIKHGVMRRAARKLLKYMADNADIVGARAAQIDTIVPTGTSREVIRTIETALDGAKKPLPATVTVTRGVPGRVGTALKGLSLVGGVVSTYQLYHDVQKGDVASGIGSGAGVLTSTLELGAIGLGSTALATTSALTGSFALGYAAGTAINDHVLEEETKSLIGETLVEFIDNGWTDIKEFYFGIKPAR